jgi:hypothetical protein
LHSQILMMCGARNGARFSSLDVNRLRIIAESLEARYDAVDETFRSLPTEVMRYRFPGVKKLEDDPSHFEFLSNRRRNSLVGMEELNLEDKVRRQAFHFQWLARQYVVTFAQLKTAMLEICDRVRKDMAALGALTPPSLADINDAGLSPLLSFLGWCRQRAHWCVHSFVSRLPLMSWLGPFCCAVEAEFEAENAPAVPDVPLRAHPEVPSRAAQSSHGVDHRVGRATGRLHWAVRPLFIQRLAPALAHDGGGAAQCPSAPASRVR